MRNGVSALAASSVLTVGAYRLQIARLTSSFYRMRHRHFANWRGSLISVAG